MDDIIVDSLDDLPEPLQPLKALFKEADGKFKYTPPKTEDVSGLKSALAKKQREAETATRDLAALRERLLVDGEELTPETIQELLELKRKASEQPDTDKMVARTEVDRLISEATTKLGRKHESETKPLREENLTLKETLERVLIEDGIRSACTSPDLPVKLKKGAVDLFIKAAKADKTFKIAEGKAIVASEKIAANGEIQGPLDWIIEQVLGSMALLAEDSQGSGTPPGPDGKTRMPLKASKDMNDQERIDFINKHGLPKWQEKLLKERQLRIVTAAA